LRAIHYREPRRLIEDFKAKKAIELPFKAYRIRLTTEHPERNHYCYIFQFGYSEDWLFDEATDYSGTGGRFFREMESFWQALKKIFERQFDFHFIEYDMPYDLYWLLYNLFYRLYTQPPEERERF